jgi:hypothetical protein
MPSNGFLGLSHKYITSQGEAHWLRGFFTFAVPVGMFRYPNSGLGANSSGDYERLEQPSFQAGLIYSLQCWRFDSNEPCWSFTPQLQAGILLSPWRDGLQVPRPSGILGVALRLPGGTKPTSALEASAGAIIWGEVTEGARGGVWASVLFGLAVNLGALGN